VKGLFHIISQTDPFPERRLPPSLQPYEIHDQKVTGIRHDGSTTGDTGFGHDAFRPGQEEVIRAVLDGRDALVVLPTGSGKSIMYQLPAVLLERDHGGGLPAHRPHEGPDRQARRGGRRRPHHQLGPDRTPRSGPPKRWRTGGGEILYVTPERFRDRQFFDSLLERDVNLLVVDEAHCISEWGHDFRPDYMMLGAIAERLGRPPILALTATATEDVQRDIRSSSGFVTPTGWSSI
jgi:ATP-dependent DNA helicase RecQ